MSSSIASNTQVQPRMDWSRAFLAGLAATVVMTIVMMALGTNIMKSLGSMIVGTSASPALQYAAGGAVHLMIGLFYGFVFAALFGRVREWNRFIKGIVYGLAIAAIAFAAMPLMSSMMGGGGGGATKSSGNPCHKTKGEAMASSSQAAQPAMNPCHGKEAMNPCHGKKPMNPCHGSAANPCHPGGGANPCNPCGSGGGAMSSILSLINHLIYALTLAFVYKSR